jgi:hypothetical protein
MMMVHVSAVSPPSAVTEDSISLYTGYSFSHGSVTSVSVCFGPALIWYVIVTGLAAPRTCIVAVPTGGPVGAAAGVVGDVEAVGACAVVEAADERAAAELAATGLPAVVLHPLAGSAATTTARTTPPTERCAILEAYVGRTDMLGVWSNTAAMT